jgi:hypothetical protein
MSMKNSNDTTENRTCDLPACSTVPQPTAPVHDSGAAGIKTGHYTAVVGCKGECYSGAAENKTEFHGGALGHKTEGHKGLLEVGSNI